MQFLNFPMPFLDYLQNNFKHSIKEDIKVAYFSSNDFMASDYRDASVSLIRKEIVDGFIPENSFAKYIIIINDKDEVIGVSVFGLNNGSNLSLDFLASREKKKGLGGFLLGLMIEFAAYHLCDRMNLISLPGSKTFYTDAAGGGFTITVDKLYPVLVANIPFDPIKLALRKKIELKPNTIERIKKEPISEDQNRKQIVSSGKTYRLFSNLPLMDKNPINPIDNEYAEKYKKLPGILLSNVSPTIVPNIFTATLGLRQTITKPLPSPELELDDKLLPTSPPKENVSPGCSMM